MQHRLLIPHLLLSFFMFFSLNFCVLLKHDTGHLRTQVVYEDLHMDVKGEYRSASGNPISTALKQVESLSSLCIKIPACHHFVVLVYYASST